MGQRNVRSRTGAAALALVLSLALVAGTPLDAARAYAAEPSSAATAESEGASQPDANANDAGESAKDPASNGGSSSGQLSEDVPLDAPAGAPQDGSQAPAGADAAPSAPIDQSPASGQATAAVPLVPEAPKAVVGEVVQDGLVYRILDDGESVALVGWRGTSLAGDVAVPYLVMSGEDAYAVTVIGDPDIDYTAADGSASGVLAGSEATSLSLPASVETVADGALSGCPSLESVFASPQNRKYTSSDGMLFSKDLSALLFVPEGKRGTARIPDETSSAPASAFSRVSGLSAVQAGEGSAAFSAREGVLYSKDGASLLYFPAAAGSAVVLPAETESIGEGAFAQAEGLASIVALGYVRDIHETAFAEAAKRDAQVALPAGEDYDARKAVWQAAGFQSFVEPAAPGDAVEPTDPEGQPASGFVFTLLDDYTLSVGWAGEADPEADLVIPAAAKLNDVEYRVSAIAAGGFQGRQSLSSVQIRAPITAIGDDAFAGCTGLASVELAEGVSAIGAGAFSGTAVQRAVIPASVTSVGSRAFADCPDLSQIVTFSNALSVAGDAISGCAGVSIYAPYSETGEYPWHPGLVASGNSIKPYGASFASDPLVIEVDETADLFEGGVREVPDGCELTYSYAAAPISVEAGQVTGKKIGVSEVTAVLSLDGIELARIMRVVEVVAGKPTPYVFIPDGPYTFGFDTLGGAPVPDQQSLNMTGGASRIPDAPVFPTYAYSMKPNISEPQDPAKPGYTFVGWYVKSKPDALYSFGTTAYFTDVDFVSGVVTLYAKWERIIPEGATGGVIGPAGDTVTWYITSANELVLTPTNGVSGTLHDTSVDSLFPWTGNQDITKVTIDKGVKAGTSLYRMFLGCSNLISIEGANNLDTSNTTNMTSMFSGCTNLQSVDVSAFDTSKVKIMDSMFNACSSLQSLEVSNFITGNVEKLSNMFKDCSNLQAIDVSKFDTSNATNLSAMFYGCSSLGSLSTQNWKTPNATDMTNMFRGCSNLVSLDLSSFTTSKVIGMGSMFSGCENLASLDISGFDTSKVTTMDAMFLSCKKLPSLNLSHFRTPSVNAMNSMFRDCSELAALDISNFDTSQVITTADMFYGCSKLSSLNVSSFNTENVKSMTNMFRGCASLTSLNLAGFNTSKVTGMGSMFSGCSKLESLDLSGFSTSSACSMDSMFRDCAKLGTLDMPKNKTFSASTTESMFNGCSSLQSLDLSSFDTSKVGRMDNMFLGCSALKTLDLSNFKTGSVANMGSMFKGCSALTSLNVSSFDTASNGNMNNMFYGCSSLTELNLSNFNTANVTGMQSMFYECSSLTTLDVSSFDTSKVGRMDNMFLGCSALKSLDLSNFKTGSVANMGSMFKGCSALTSLNVSSFDTASNGNMNNMFYGCSSLTELNLSSFNTSNVTGMNSMFSGCENLASLDLSTFGTANVTNMGGMFSGCKKLATIKGIEKFDTAKVTSMNSMFKECAALTSVDVSKFDTQNVGSMEYMFYGCSSLKSLDVSKFKTENVGSMGYMFQNCYGLSELNVSNFDTSKVTNMNYMFGWCSGLQALNVPNFKTSLVTGMNGMFQSCSGLKTLDLSNFETPKVTSMINMFADCSGLETLDISKFDTTLVADMGGMFKGCSNLKALDVSKFNTPNVKSMYCMFQNCSSLKELNVANFNTENVQNLNGMFSGCSNVAALDVSKFKTTAAKHMNNMFYGCSSLKSLDVSKFDTSNVVNMESMFFGCSSLGVLDVSGFATSNVTNMGNMFNDCSSLAEIDVSKFDTSNVMNMGHLFFNCSNLSSLDVSKLETSKVEYMDYMFADCSKLEVLDVSGFKTELVTNMDAMFANCAKLGALDVAGFATSKVTNMGNMFNNCSGLTSLDVSNFVTDNVENMAGMFNGCSGLSTLDLSNFSTEKVARMRQMFYGCSGLAQLNISSFRTSNVTNMEGMFSGCSALTALDLSNWNTGNVQVSLDMYKGCSTLAEVKVGTGYTLGFLAQPAGYTDWKNSNGASFAYDKIPSGVADTYTAELATYSITYELNGGTLPNDAPTSFTMKSADITLPTPALEGNEFLGWYASADFSGDCALLIPSGSTGNKTFYAKWKRSIPSGAEGDTIGDGITWYITEEKHLVIAPTNGISGTLPRYVDDATFPWSKNAFIKSATIEPGVAANVDIAHMFEGCTSLQSVDISGLVTSNVQSMASMFAGCSSLAAIDVSKLDTSKVENMGHMFTGCSSLGTLDLSGFNTERVKYMDHMFEGCLSLESLSISNFATPSVKNMAYMFAGCSNLADVTLPDGFVSASVTDASKLFFDCPALTTVPANLAFPESVPTAQAFGFTEAPAEFVATTYEGSDPQLTAYDWVADCRLLNGAEASGRLQTTDNLNRAWWSVDTSGTLTIGCEEGAVIADLGWVAIDGAVDAAPAEGAWSAVRGFVSKIVMEPGVAAENAGAWFAGMTKLTDISQARIPAEATFTNSMFDGCTSLSEIPEGFSFPDSVTAARSMFRNCSNLASLPEGFTLQGTALTDAHSFFLGTGLRYLPEKFAFPENATNLQHFFSGSKLVQLPETFSLPSAAGLYVNRMFADCSSLEALPKGFTILENCVEAEEMFIHCSSLEALPEGFSIPKGAGVKMMLYGCSKLSSLPASLKLNDLNLSDEVLKHFLSASDMVPTYYAGDPADVPVADYWSTNWNRQLITSGSLPDGAYSVGFKLPDASGAYTEAAWLTSVTGTDGILQEMAAPTREGYAFMGWYVDEACTIAFDFTKSVTAQAEGASNPVTTLYARYTEARSTLPTTDGGEHASWKLSQDGTLRISCEDGYTIADLGWNADEAEHLGHWSTVGSHVERVVMDGNVKASSMAFWFDGMPNLSDISQVFIPEGTESVRALFRNCTKISVIPDDFRLPASVRHAGALFELTSIRTLPSGFTITEGVEDTSWMFNGCSSLEVLPEAFTLATSVTNAQRMFSACTALTKLPEDFRWHTQSDVGYMFNGCTGLLSLPDGFTVPKGIKSITTAFRNCSSLRTLPSKFTIPEGVTNTTELFNGCSSLQSLPEGFSFPSSLRWINKMFYGCNNLRILPSTLSLKGLNADANRLLAEAFYVTEGGPLATYYPGDAAEATPSDGYWETQNRTLVTKTDDLPAGVKVVHFKTASLTTPGQWDDFATVLTDENGKLTQPGDPQAFGYPFKGWYINEACVAKFDFSKQITVDDVVVYGAFGAPILRGTVPLEANVVVDASGGATTASAEIRSFTPVDIDLTSIACETAPGIAELFPDEADRTKPFVTVRFPDQAEPVKVPFTGQPAATSVTVPLSTGWTSPGTKSCDISLDLNGANMRHRIEDHSANVANIVWTIKVKE